MRRERSYPQHAHNRARTMQAWRGAFAGVMWDGWVFMALLGLRCVWALPTVGVRLVVHGMDDSDTEVGPAFNGHQHPCARCASC